MQNLLSGDAGNWQNFPYGGNNYRLLTTVDEPNTVVLLFLS